MIDLEPVNYSPAVTVIPPMQTSMHSQQPVQQFSTVDYSVQTPDHHVYPQSANKDSTITQASTTPLLNTGNFVNIQLNDPQGLARTKGYTKTSGNIVKTK